MQDSEEDELVSVMDNVLDGYEEDQVPAVEPDPRPDPVGMVAEEMVASAFKDRPDLMVTCTTKGAVIVVSTPFGWVDAVAPAWRREVLGQPEFPADVDSYPACRKREKKEEKWPLGVGFDSVQKDFARDSLGRALRTGRGVLVTATSLASVNVGLRAVADAVVEVLPPSSGNLRRMAASLGDGVGSDIDPSVAAAVQPCHLLGCLRPGQSDASYLERRVKVAIASMPPARAKVAPTWTLDRLHGNDEVRAFGKGLAKDMRACVAGHLPWEDVPPGILLSGPPGCGKTITAKAIATACGVPLIGTSYSEWQSAGREGHLGEVMKSLRASFQRARMSAPLMFIDEIDSVRGRSNSAVSVRGHDEWWTALNNALLEEMDGVQTHPGIVFIAASNHPQKVDPALRRSGRLDREICLSPPGASAISAIIREHLGSDNLPGVDLSPVANAALGGRGADVASWVSQARQAARHAGRPMMMADPLAAISPQVHPISPEAWRRLAHHEAGHFVVAVVVCPGSLRMVSIRPASAGASSTGGAEIASPGRGEDTVSDVDAVLMRLLGGRAGELVAFGMCGGGSGGSENSDLARATLIAASAEFAWWMGGRLS